ncbi:multicopper oxidase domain-containing protein [Aquisalimonas lutea]|uniref:multicopper oxidase family protein n=1 Tax=Aquisalimonas lutea TaxID=1327750 RepID=UPI0025B4AB67|nr:multicopper oxidase domain-containing protein [Aquisalimonas lutea]MDN3519089.1 multicopper oxidase domain-containing protein [Aquisalimonas lutea]
MPYATAMASGREDGAFDVDLRLRAHADEVPIFSGPASEVWRYTAERIAGPADTLTALGESYPGPLIRLRRGQRLRVELRNELPEDTTVHWHGLHVPSEVDGQPRLPIAPGARQEIAFDVRDRAGLYWYHPHPHGPRGGRVGFQAYAGLAGPLMITDEQEQALELPAGEQEFVLLLQDRSFTRDNQLQYIGDGMGSMMTRMRGFRGNRMLVNGRPDARRDVATQPYRLRILNGSNARIYKLAWSDGRPVTVIGTDGGLLAAPEQRAFVTLAPAQRTDLWVDFGGAKPGDSVRLVSEAYEMSGMGGGMMGGGMMGSQRESLVTFRITSPETDPRGLPERLAEDLPAPSIRPDTPVRRFTLGMRMMRGFTINGRQMNGTNVADDEIVTLGDTEIWEFVNDTMMPHPMHVHGLQFHVHERIAEGSRTELHDGLIDAGLHDTVLVFPGERVRLAMTFEHFTGLYMYHCHNMEHEDAGMMRYFRVDPSRISA